MYVNIALDTLYNMTCTKHNNPELITRLFKKKGFTSA